MSRATSLATAAAARAAQSSGAKSKAAAVHRSEDIFGGYKPTTVLLASRDHPITMAQRAKMMRRLEEAHHDLSTAEDPGVNSWRDITDALNYLQSAQELGFIVDEGGQIDGTKTALLQAAESWQTKDRMRLTGPNLTQLLHCIEQFGDLTTQQPAYDFWRVVRHTKQRIQAILRGNKAPGDTVIAL